MKIIGFSVGHDRGAVLIVDGEVIVGITQERLSRVKHDGGYMGGQIPIESIQYCLNHSGLKFSDINLWAYSTTEEVDDVDEKMTSILGYGLGDKLLFVPHHLAHAYSSFFSSNFDEAAVIVADASGSIYNSRTKLSQFYDLDTSDLTEGRQIAEGISIYHFKRDSYSEVFKKWIKIPHLWNTEEEECTSLGARYSEGSLQLVYEQTTHSWSAGKLMGMASYANQKKLDEIPTLVQELENDIHLPNIRILPNVMWNSDFQSKSDVAGLYQREQEQASVILSRIAKNLTSSKNVCTAGGSFLNCNSNRLILDSGLFDECYFVPPSDDSGIPLGCAWFAYQKIAFVKQYTFLNPYLGKKYDRNEIISALNEVPNLNVQEFESFPTLCFEVSELLSENKVIGWFQDGSEIGPRALGNRSIIANPTSEWISNYINSEVKFREWYRPFAPAVIYEHQKKIFDTNFFSPYMLVTAKVLDDWKEKIPSVVHIDGTSRFQSVTENSNFKFYSLLTSFYMTTGIPVLLNTSFNGPDEPIVETPSNAINTFLKRNLDYLVLDNFLVSKQ
jgi:carbamoyltransferase